MSSHIVEWLNLIVRWFHFTTGVAWIGASFYFNWLENNLNRQGQRDEIAGSLWAVHGGGFYYLEKYKIGPSELPKTLHWFKYEAYFTWISGMALLVLVYYWNASLYLIDPARAALTPPAAIAISLAVLTTGWIVYDQLCKSPLGRSNARLGIVGFALIVCAAFGLSHLFSPRGAFIHVGSIIGTCMVANVFRVIIPSQKVMVDAAKAGLAPDGAFGKRALQRSLHNNYMTLPVLFIMISSHFPSTYSPSFNWAMLAGLSLVGAGVRHWFNLKGRGQRNVWILPVAAIAMLGLCFVASPKFSELGRGNLAAAPAEKVSFATVQKIVTQRCVSCHGTHPTDDVFTVPPAGLVLDSAEQIKNWALAIKDRAVTLENMPFANKTGMTKEEREQIGRWVDAGAETN